MSVVLYSGSRRARTAEAGRVTWHSFAFGAHYDPANVAFGPLVAYNDEWLSPGAGYADHSHREVEIVTWVLSGTLLHRDDQGAEAALGPGTVQVQSAGSGLRHAEVAGDEPTRFVQSWLVPDAPGGELRRATARPAPLAPGRWVPLAGGAGLRLGCAGPTLWVARLVAGQRLTAPDGPRVHVFVATGEVGCGGEPETLNAGDALRVSDERAPALVATAPSEVLVWCLP